MKVTFWRRISRVYKLDLSKCRRLTQSRKGKTKVICNAGAASCSAGAIILLFANNGLFATG
jgi:hypothetical protein